MWGWFHCIFNWLAAIEDYDIFHVINFPCMMNYGTLAYSHVALATSSFSSQVSTAHSSSRPASFSSLCVLLLYAVVSFAARPL